MLDVAPFLILLVALAFAYYEGAKLAEEVIAERRARRKFAAWKAQIATEMDAIINAEDESAISTTE